MREGLVGIGHAMRILPPLYCDASIVGGIEELPGEPLFHRVFGTAARARDQPADRKSLAAVGAHLDRDLVGGAADSAGAHLDCRADIAERVVEDPDRILAAALGDAVERAVDDALSDR